MDRTVKPQIGLGQHLHDIEVRVDHLAARQPSVANCAFHSGRDPERLLEVSVFVEPREEVSYLSTHVEHPPSPAASRGQRNPLPAQAHLQNVH